MLTAFIRPARCVDVNCFANASTATRPSGSYGNKAAAMPCTLRRGAWRSSNSSIVILGSPQSRVSAMGSGTVSEKSMSAFLGLLQLLGHVRVLVVFVQRIATGGQSVAWCRRAIAKGPANQLALDLSA